jgi:transcription antitermination factor NusA-like protein
MENILPVVDIYSKANCHLCDEAKAVIAKVNQDTPFVFSVIDINSDPELFEKYKYEIPVININGIIAFKYKVDEAEFRKKLKRKF